MASQASPCSPTASSDICSITRVMLSPAFGRLVPWQSAQYFVKVWCVAEAADAGKAP